MSDNSVEKAMCDCARGQYYCHHIAAVMLYANRNMSSTDVVCQWSQRKSTAQLQYVPCYVCFHTKSRKFF